MTLGKALSKNLNPLKEAVSRQINYHNKEKSFQTISFSPLFDFDSIYNCSFVLYFTI